MSKIKKIIKSIMIDKSEKEYLSRKDKVVLVQIVRGYYEFSLLEKILKLEKITPDIKIVGLESKVVYFSFIDYILLIPFIAKSIIHILRKRKWRKLYRSIGVDSFISDKYYISNWKAKDFKKLINIFLSTKKKNEVLNIKIDNINLGDLIYDTYIRYYYSPTISLRNFNFFSILCHAIGLTRNIKKISNIYDIKLYVAQYSNYVNSGLPCRLLTKYNIRSLALGNDLNIVKELSYDDPKRAPNHSLYSKRFELIKNKKSKINKGLNRLKSRISGNIDIVGMRNSSFSKDTNVTFDKNIEGVVFLHDIFDAQHMYEHFCFNDLYEWTIFNLELIRNEKLKIGVKPHINQKKESLEIIRHLMKKYDDIYWIDPTTSNNLIFKHISFGCTVFGTIITELAYHNIIPICCGDNPTSSFNICYQANSPEEYKSLILNYTNLNFKPAKDQIGAFMYMHYESNKLDYYKSIKLNRIDSNSKILKDI